MKRVVFVCTGNACRSPFAECVLRTLLEREGIQDVEVCSMGTLSWGQNPRDEVMTRIASEMGYRMTGETAPLNHRPLSAADWIIVFTRGHRDAVTRVLGYNYWDRIMLFDQWAFGTDTEVEDPNFQSEAVYRRVAQHIEEGCRRKLHEFR